LKAAYLSGSRLRRLFLTRGRLKESLFQKLSYLSSLCERTEGEDKHLLRLRIAEGEVWELQSSTSLLISGLLSATEGARR